MDLAAVVGPSIMRLRLRLPSSGPVAAAHIVSTYLPHCTCAAYTKDGCGSELHCADAMCTRIARGAAAAGFKVVHPGVLTLT